MDPVQGRRTSDDRPTQAYRPTDGGGEASRTTDDRPTQANRGPDAAAGESRSHTAPTEAVRPAARTGEVLPADARSGVTVRRLRRGRLAVRKIDPWAVFKFSLVFYFCMLLIALLGTAIIFAVLKLLGVIDSLENVLAELLIDVSIAGGTIFKWFFLFGLVGTVIASIITVFMAFLYNLIADVVGGIELLVTERE